MGSVAVDIAAHLENESLGVVGSESQWGIYIGKEPPAPNDCITVYDTGGAEGNPDGPIYRPTIQVRVRSHDYSNGYNKAEAIRDALILPTAFVLNDRLFVGAWLISDVAKIGTDENDRELFTVNFRLMLEPYTTA